ncbi:hypothetical protein M1M88_01250 [Peptococcaceae bacterium]|nr:hypothetical protein [Peptococcaceae bacterium]
MYANKEKNNFLERKKQFLERKKKKKGIPKTFKTFIGMCRKIKKLFY